MKLCKATSFLLVCIMALSLLLAGCHDTPEQAMGDTTTTTTIATDGSNTTNSSIGTAVPSGGVTVPSNGTAPPSDEITNSSENMVGNTTTSDAGGTGVAQTTTTVSSTASISEEEPLLPSFERLSDGTCKDRETGVVFIDDDCNSVSLGSKACLLYDCGGKVHVDENQRTLMNNDPARFVRDGTSGASNWWVSYKLPKGVTEVAIESTSMHTDWIGFDVYVSKDNKNWKKVDLKIDSKETKDLGYDWYLRVHKATGIDKSNIYVKVQFVEELNGPFYDPNICRIRINNIDKMNDADRFLEGRVSQTFYVSASGSDANDGLSPEKPWKTTNAVSSRYYQPGDKILFKAGDTFTGTVKITGFGSASKRVTVGTYGGDGNATIQSRSTADTLFEIACDYITVENLTITSKQGRIGMLVCAAHTGANKDIVIQDCTFKDINISAESFKYETGALQLSATGTEPTWFENVIIRNNTFSDVARCGIFASTTWGSRDRLIDGEYKNGDEPWYANRNFSISNNILLDVQGDGIFVQHCNGVVIEKNYINNAYCAEQSALKAAKKEGINIAVAALWTLNVDKAYIQYNDVGYTNLPRIGTDGQAFDIDGGNTDHYIQYNYSHNNAGGLILFCDVESFYDLVKDTENHIRFNLSVGDAYGYGKGIFVGGGSHSKMSIYNNTIIQTGESKRLFYAEGDVKNYVFQNNVFYGGTACTIGTQPATYKCENIVFDDNIFFGGTPECSSTGVTIKNIKNVDPIFKNTSFTNPSGQNLRKEAIVAFTPQAKLSGATAIGNSGGKDINGKQFKVVDFYGCVKN